MTEQVAWLQDPPEAVLPRLEIRIPGVPIPQGSLRAFTRNGRAWASSDNPRTRPWKAAVTAEAALAVEQAGFETPAYDRRPVAVAITFALPRPKGHFGKKGLLPSAPRSPAVMPDLDKLVRAVLDALTGIVWRDDAQVVAIEAYKRYSDDLVTVVEVSVAR
jgi:Holliday junction resolvase RusA-like endonuclease